MAVQVGSLCYAGNVEAAAAACAAHATTITVSGSSLVTVSCSGAINGKMQINTLVSPVDGSASGIAHLVEVAPEFPPCRQGEVWDAGMTVVVAFVAAVVVPWYTWKWISRMLNWGRGEAA